MKRTSGFLKGDSTIVLFLFNIILKMRGILSVQVPTSGGSHLRGGTRGAGDQALPGAVPSSAAISQETHIRLLVKTRMLHHR